MFLRTHSSVTCHIKLIRYYVLYNKYFNVLPSGKKVILFLEKRKI